MYFSDLATSLRRRWYLVIVGLLFTTGMVVAAVRAFPATYSSQAVVVLLPPRSIDAANPYLAIGGAEGVVPALTAAMTDSKTVLALEADGVSRHFTVAQDFTAGGPLLLVTSEESTAAHAIDSLDTLVARTSSVLNTLQAEAGAPASSRVSSAVIARDAEPKTVRKSQIRAVLAAGAAGLVLTVLIAAAVDGLLLRRRGRKSHSVGAAEDLRKRRTGESDDFESRHPSAEISSELSHATVVSGDTLRG